jgi:hypothetical protein
MSAIEGLNSIWPDVSFVPVAATSDKLDAGPGAGDRRDARLDAQVAATTNAMAVVESVPDTERSGAAVDKSIAEARARSNGWTLGSDPSDPDRTLVCP